MKVKKLGSNILKLGLCTALAGSLCTDFMVMRIRANDSYVQNFDDPNLDMSNWKKEVGAGIFEHKDGKLNIETAGWVPGSVDYQLYYDQNAPVVANGSLSADIQSLNANGRFAMVFRYKDAKNYDYVGYDIGGSWKLVHRVNGKDTEKTIKTGLNIDNQSFHFEVIFIGNTINVYVNNNLIYTGADLTDDATGGKIGIKTWGYTDNYAHITVDNLKLEKRNAPEQDADGNYMVTFTDETKRGGWQKIHGNGTIAFTDGQGADGFMSVKANYETIYTDTLSPNIKNGFIEADVTNRSDGRIGFLFRQKSATVFAGLGYDGNGVWNWITGNGGYGEFTSGAPLANGQKNHIRIEYVGANIRLLINGREVGRKNVAELNLDEGNIGLRTWGYDEGNTQGGMDIDNIVVGKFNAVLLNPENKTVRYHEAGTYDIPVSLSQVDNAFERLEVDGQPLTVGKDYTVNADASIITLTKEWIAQKKTEGGTSTAIKFIFADGYIATFNLQVLGKPSDTKETYMRDFAKGIDGFEKVIGSGTITNDTNKKTLDITNANNLVMIDKNSPDLHNSEVEYTFDPKNDNGNFGIVVRYENENSWTMIGQEGAGANSTSWIAYTSNGQKTKLCDDGNRIYAKRVKPYKVKVRVVEDVVTIFLDNAEIYTGKVAGMTNGTGKSGIRNWGGSGTSIPYMTVSSSDFVENETSAITSKSIASTKMNVEVDANFPRIIDYTVDGKVMKGQEKPVYVVEVNNVYYKPAVTSEIAGVTAIYHITIKDINVSFDVEFKVEGNTVAMRIKNIKDEKHAIYTINFPGHSLVSAASNQAGANLRVNNYRNEQNIDLVKRQDSDTYSETTLAVLSTNDLSASISNGSIKRRQEVAYQTFVNGDHYTTGLWANEYLYRGLDGEVIEEPWTKITVTGDRNKDGKVDFQDGAIARRDDIGIKYTGSDVVMDAFNMIAMNVGSNAQYPFLRILDNIKKFDLGTDGFQQNIIIKGYQSEGHDAAHPDFANYNTRAGGLVDFNKLLSEAENYHATVGVHINHTESYPEAKQYGDVVSTVGGWSWYDDAKQMIRENDILNKNGGMAQRLQQLDDDTLHKLAMIYVDVYFDTRWPMDQLTSKINAMHNMAVGTEYVDEMTTSSVWGHHIDGRFNNAGDLVRIISNSSQDIFGGNALFRDANTRNVGFDGWQNSVNYNDTMQLFYTQVLPNKFLAQFPIMKYDSSDSVTLGENNEVVSTLRNSVNKITKDGNLIADGNKIFIPWAKDEQDTSKEGKIYHWNQSGGTSTWTLPKSWNDESNVMLYELSDQGKSTPVTLNVTNHQVSIQAKAKTGYVIYKGSDSSVKATQDMKWSDGSVVKDMGFDSHAFDYAWHKAKGGDTVNFVNNKIGNTHMMMTGASEGEISQKMTGLIPGQSYSASVWLEVKNGKTGTIEVQNGTEDVSNYIEKSNVKFGVHHTDKYNTNAQRVGFKFVAQGSEATIKLKAKASGENGSADFDDVRVRPVGISAKGDHTFFEDFENVDEGFGPFVSTESDHSHLSETHKPYTNDTITGRYSLKVRAGDVMRTLPQTIRFQPNTNYSISMDYIARQENLFTVKIKTDDGNRTIVSQTCGGKNSDPRKVTLHFTTGGESDTYLEIAPTKAGNGEYILDNLAVDEAVNVDKDTLKKLQDKALSMLKQTDVYTADSLQVIRKISDEVTQILAKDHPTQEEMETAYHKLDKAMQDAIKFATEQEKTDLTTLITQMENLDPKNYEQDAAWEILQSTITQAKALVKKEHVTQPEIMEMKQALQDAKDALHSVVKKTKLKELLEICKAIALGDYVDGAENSHFNSVKAQAQTVFDKEDAAQDEVDKAYEDLLAAHNALIPTASTKDTLTKDTLDLATKALKNENYYDAEAYQALQAAVNDVNMLLTNAKANLGDIQKAIADINKAIDNKKDIMIKLIAGVGGTATGGGIVKAGEQVQVLAEPASTYDFDGWYVDDQLVSKEKAYDFIATKDITLTAKFASISTVKLEALLAKVNGLDASDYTAASWANLQEVVKEAKVLLASDYTTETIRTMIEKMELAIASLEVSKDIDKAALEKYIHDNELMNIKSDTYVSTSFKPFEAALQHAMEILQGADATAKDYKDALIQLQKTRTNLVLKASEQEMHDLSNLLESYHKEAYTSASWDVFYKILNETKAILVRNDSSSNDIQALKDKVLQAAKHLVGNTTTNALQEAIKKAEAIDARGYTTDSYKAMQDALRFAKSVLGNKNATQQQIDDALAKLQKTITALKSASANSVDTKDTTNRMLYASYLLLGAGVMGYAYKKSIKKHKTK